MNKLEKQKLSDRVDCANQSLILANKRNETFV